MPTVKELSLVAGIEIHPSAEIVVYHAVALEMGQHILEAVARADFGHTFALDANTVSVIHKIAGLRLAPHRLAFIQLPGLEREKPIEDTQINLARDAAAYFLVIDELLRFDAQGRALPQKQPQEVVRKIGMVRENINGSLKPLVISHDKQVLILDGTPGGYNLTPEEAITHANMLAYAVSPEGINRNNKLINEVANYSWQGKITIRDKPSGVSRRV